jgi:hypothetical protein
MILWLVARAHAASVTVSPGDDLNALTSSLQPGDVVTFNPGTYALYDTVYWTGVGTADAPIQLVSSGKGEVVLQKQGGGWVAQVNDSSYLKIHGLTFSGTDGTTSGYGGDQPSGLYVNNSTYVTVEDCVLQKLGGDAIRIDGDSSHLTIEHNEVASSSDGSGIAIGCWDASCWMSDSTVSFNLIHDVDGNGIDLDAGTQGSKFEHNVIFRTGDTAIVVRSTNFGPQNIVNGNAMWDGQNDGIYAEGSALIQNNLIFQFAGSGIYSRNDYDDGLVDLQISHNTVANTEDWAVRLEDWYDRDNLVFANNAVANPIGRGLYWDDWSYDPYGGYYGTTGTYPDTTNYLSHNVVTGLVDGFDPIQRPDFILPGGGVTDFTDSENLDFYPTSTSMLRDMGDANGQAYIPQYDFNGTARDGESPDVGAYEYDGDGNPGWTVQEGFMSYQEHEGRNTVGLSSGCCGGSKSDTAAIWVPAPFLVGSFLRRRRSRR